MKMTYQKNQKSVQNLCKTSEVFCKPTNLPYDGLNEINNIENSCASYDDHTRMMCKPNKSIYNQQVVMIQDVHCRPPCYYITGGSNTPPVCDKKLHRQLEVAKRIDFSKIPEIGTVLMIDGQRYILFYTSPYQKTKGLISSLLCWKNNCSECGDRFVATSDLKGQSINRRCSLHHRNGVSVIKSKHAWRGGAK